MPLGWVAGAMAVGSIYSASQAADASENATNAAANASARQDALSEEQFKWNKDIYERDVRPSQLRAEQLNEKIANDALESSQQQRKFADEQTQYYKDTYQPVEKKMVDEAMNYDSEGNISRRSGIAAANVNQQFSNVRGQSARLAGRYGLGSTAMSGPAGASERAQALGAAGASTGAAFDTMDKGIALRAGAANFGRNMPNTAAQFGQVGNQSSGVASGAANSALNSTITGSNFMNNAYNTQFGNIGNSSGLFINAQNNAANMWGNSASGFASASGSLFARSGLFKKD